MITCIPDAATGIRKITVRLHHHLRHETYIEDPALVASSAAVEKPVQRDVTVIVEEGGGGGVYAPSASVASTSGASSPPPRRDSGSRSGHGKAPAAVYLAQ